LQRAATITTRRGLVERLNDGATPHIVAGYLLSFMYVVVVVLPLYYVLVSAFKNNLEIFGAPLSLPNAFSLTNFLKAEEVAVMSRAMAISFGVTVGSEMLTLVLAFPAAYAIARIRIGLAAWTELIFSLGFLIPPLAMLVPVYLTTARLGLLYNPLALVLFYPATKLSVSILLLASYLRSVPIELEESAQIDGASRLQMILHIFFPLARPGVITVLVLNFIDFWNEYLFALVLLSSKNRTLQIALTILKNERAVDYGMITAGVLMAVIPVYLVFVFFQEQITRGVYAGALKG
jgi:multiple sugar transport system permease protein